MPNDQNELDARDHYEALFDKTYLRWFHLNNEPALVKITGIERGVELTLRGGAKKKAGILTIQQLNGKIETPVKPLVLNVTNGNSIAEIHGPKPSQWIGAEIVLYPTTTERPEPGRGKITVGCIRIRARKAPK